MSRIVCSLALALLPAIAVFAQSDPGPSTNQPYAPGSIEAILSEQSGSAYDQDHAKLIKSAEAVGALGPDLFGESVNFYTGATQFSHTDYSIPGNGGLPVKVSRRLSVEGEKFEPFGNSLGDWELDLPYVGGIFMRSAGWKVSVGTVGSDQRCSDPTTVLEAQPVSVGNGGDGFTPIEYWRGYSMYVPGSGEQSLLLNNVPGTVSPSQDGPYPWTTNAFWQIACTTLTGGGAGQGFIALAPNGTRYHFTHMVKRGYRDIGEMTGEPGWVSTERDEIRIYATRIEDRFGNRVDYSWTGDRLDSITSNDQRTLIFEYDGVRIDKVRNAGVVVVDYGYVNANSEGDQTLRNVTYADGSQWVLNLEDVYPQHFFNCANLPDPQDPFRCWDPASPHCGFKRLLADSQAQGTITHPSGASGTFSFRYKRHIRASVPDTEEFCPTRAFPGIPGWPNQTPDPPDEPWEFASLTPRVFDVLALVKKQISGTGLASSLTWDYDYLNLPFTQQLPYLYDPVTRIWTVNPNYTGIDYAAPERKLVAKEPGGIRRDFSFGNRYDFDEGRLLRVETYGDHEGTNLVHSTVNTYVQKSQLAQPAYPFPDRVGTNPLWTPDNIWAEWLLPQINEQTLQDGVTFTREIQQFDTFAHPVKVRRQSALGVRIDETEYAHNTALWVLGLPTSVFNVDIATGLRNDRISQTVYYAENHASKLLPKEQYSFDRLVSKFEYDALGNLSKASDAKDNATTLAQYHRGVPQSIGFANNKFLTATVNDLGRLENTTDMLGTTTAYDYDVMGRLRLVDYLADADADWSSRHLEFVRVTGNELGIIGVHWKQISRTDPSADQQNPGGGVTTTTYFDALWRPILIATVPTDAPPTYVVKRYDERGREVFTSYPVSELTDIATVQQGTRTEYDALGRVTKVKVNSELGQLTTQTEYLTGLKTRVTSPKHYDASPAVHTTTSYQAFDAPSYDAPVLIQAPECVTTVINRDVYGKPTSVTRSGPADGVCAP